MEQSWALIYIMHLNLHPSELPLKYDDMKLLQYIFNIITSNYGDEWLWTRGNIVFYTDANQAMMKLQLWLSRL
jgi:hypothetical protein